MKLRFAVAVVALSLSCAAPAHTKSYTRNVAIVVYENAEPLDWTGPFEVYNNAGHFAMSNGEPAFNVYVVSKTKEKVNSQGLHVMPNHSIQDAPKPDIVLFPGGPSNKITDDPEFFAWSQKAAAEAEIAQSVCTGAFVLGKAGMLDGLEVTTFHGAIDGLQKRYPKAQVKRGRRFIDNGKIVTTAGISAGIDGSLHVVARLLGRRTADAVANYMEYAWVPEASLADQYSYFNPSADERQRRKQAADLQYESKNYLEAERAYRAMVDQDASDFDAMRSLAVSLRAQEKHVAAAETFVRLAETQKGEMTGHAWYAAAVDYAQAGRKNDAVGSLEKAYAAGYSNPAIATEPALATVITDPRVKQLMAKK